jgi:hypothetical protein
MAGRRMELRRACLRPPLLLHETHGPIDGLVAYAEYTGATWARESADAAVELLLDDRVLQAVRPGAAGEVLHPSMLWLRYPAYWHYGLLRSLVVLARAGAVADPRTADARDRLYARRASDGRWPADGAWWRRGPVLAGPRAGAVGFTASAGTSGARAPRPSAPRACAARR